MENGHFDQLTKLFVKTKSRRSAMTVAAGGVLATALTRLAAVGSIAGSDDLGAERRRRRRCPRQRRCAGGCCPKGQICAGGTCVTGRGTCPVGADTCVGEIENCNGSPGCFCVRTIEGPTRCGIASGIEVECASSAECAALLPTIPGVFCAVNVGGAAGNCGTQPTACGRPCPS